MVGQTAGLGLALTALVGAVVGLGWGRSSALAAMVFGLLATGLQAVAVGLAAPRLKAGDYRGLLARWGAGSLLRLGGIAVVPVAVMLDRATFPPLAVASGYLAVMVPLFFFEIRRFR